MSCYLNSLSLNIKINSNLSLSLTQRKAKGHELLEQICDHLNLLEKDYFGLTYEDRNDPRNWLEMDKRIAKFVKNEPWKFNFEVKFYPPDPAQLQEDITRWASFLKLNTWGTNRTSKRKPHSFVVEGPQFVRKFYEISFIIVNYTVNFSLY